MGTLKIYRPVQSNQVNQKFGANLACCRLGADGQPLHPYKVIGAISDGICPIGSTPFYKALGMLGHNGLDLAAYHGEPVYFSTVADVEWEASSEVDQDGGIGVNVRSKQPVSFENLPPQAHGSLGMIQKQWMKLGGKCYIYFKFWHLLKHNVYDKKPIKAGDIIGWADSTGAAGGDHLHWSMKFSDETSWFSIDSDNGYTGACDFDQWFENKFILDIINPEPKKSDEFDKQGDEYEKQGNHKLATIYHAIAGLLRSFGN